MLHSPIYDQQGAAYCGPTAIAAITGLSITKVRKMIRRVRSDWGRELRRQGYRYDPVSDVTGRKKAIKGIYDSEMVKVMKRAGYPVKSRFKGRSITLRAFLEDRAHLGPAIIQIAHHFIAVSRGMLCDTYTKQPIPWEQYPRLRSRVVKAWYF